MESGVGVMRPDCAWESGDSVCEGVRGGGARGLSDMTGECVRGLFWKERLDVTG